MEQNNAVRRECFRLCLVLVAALLSPFFAQAAENAAASSSEHWKTISAYNDAVRARWAKESEIRDADISADERERLRQALGPAPDVADAVAAALAIIESNGERPTDAADFLLSRARLSEQQQQLAWDAVTAHVGPDWSVIRDFVDASNAWRTAERAIHATNVDEEDKARRLRDLGDAPKVYRATAAALAIVDAEGVHEKTREAAEFLLDNPTRGGVAKVLRGARALATHFPDYDQWPLRLKQVHAFANIFDPAKSFVTALAMTLKDPEARATARYFAAGYLIQSANSPQLDVEERIDRRESAAELATGLGAGIEDRTFVLTKRGPHGNDVPMTFADAEAELLYSLDSTMVGSVVSDVAARRVDGTEDSLAAYAGRVVLVDFWATWCGPCLAAFPKLREMTEELPSERFQIIGVNVDEELETATDYLADRPLQWVVWHVGKDSELVRRWRVTGFPTYVLIGPEGTILNKHPGTFNAEFKAEIEQAVRDAEGSVAASATTP